MGLCQRRDSPTPTNCWLTHAMRRKPMTAPLLPISGSNTVVMDLNTIAWASTATVLGGGQYSASATLPLAKNDLTSDLNGNLSGGAGFADSYYLPLILGWNEEPVCGPRSLGIPGAHGSLCAGRNQQRRLRILDLHRVKRANVLSDKGQITQPVRLRDVRIPYHAGRHRDSPGGPPSTIR
jgi:hypothetical protein